MIVDPVTLTKEAKVKDALHLMSEYGIGGIPIVDENRKLIGMVTNRDLRFEKRMERPLSEIMITDLITTHVAPLLPRLQRFCSATRLRSSPW
jgi:IMP dehydrogenase